MNEGLEYTCLAGESCSLECIGNAGTGDTYLWTDITANPNIDVYTVNVDGISKTSQAENIPKYDNFAIDNAYPHATTLIVSKISLEDGGEYKCELLVGSAFTKRYTVNVEVAPQDILLTSSSVGQCPPPPPDVTPSEVMGVCTAIGAYPQSLEIHCNGEVCLEKNFIPSVDGPDGTYDISCQCPTFPTVALPHLEWEIKGKKVEVDLTYYFRPPNCELQVRYSQSCAIATLTCSCINAAPNVNVYNFYNQQRQLLGSPQTSNARDVEILPDQSFTFYCRGCNGVNYGEHSFARSTFSCTKPTERPRVTSKSGRFTSGGNWFIFPVGLTVAALVG